MSSLLVDSHCHLDRLDLAPFEGKLEGALDNARQHGVGHMLCVCIDLEHFSDVLEPARTHKNIFASVGVHPNERDGEEPDVKRLVELADDPDVVAIGETGLDYFRTEEKMDWQQQRFRNHIAAAKQTGKPLIIHMRDATDDTLRIMHEESAGDAGGVMHCFVEDWETAKKAMDLGFYISFSGIVTFKNATELKEVAKKMPADLMLVETDSPYLAPTPYRGKSNQPAYVKYVAEHIAELRGESVQKITETTTENFFQLFSAAHA
jgi:TatD DNase family protein